MNEFNFIEKTAVADMENGVFSRPLMTRFAPEPGGYLHLGHAKGIYASWNLARRFNGYFNLRLDDTDPYKDYAPYISQVIDDLEVLGIDFRSNADRVFYASDYFDALYEYAAFLIKKGLAYICDLNEEEFSEYRGDYHRAGIPSPYRERSAE